MRQLNALLVIFQTGSLGRAAEASPLAEEPGCAVGLPELMTIAPGALLIA